jgi:hypothetical protein
MIKLSPSDVAGPLFDGRFEERESCDRSMLPDLLSPFGARDGWRRNSCLQGSELMCYPMAIKVRYLYTTETIELCITN